MVLLLGTTWLALHKRVDNPETPEGLSIIDKLTHIPIKIRASKRLKLACWIWMIRRKRLTQRPSPQNPIRPF